jgi:uncharacterized protein (DUF952 family)
MTRQIAYKVLTAAQFAALEQEKFEGAPVDIADGYIHLSDATQLTGTVRKHFAGQEGLMVLGINLLQLSGPVRWEVSRGGQLFPHLYGRLRMADVLAHTPLRWQDGAVVLPIKALL